MNISKIIGWSAGLIVALSATVLAAQGFGPRMGGGTRQAMAGQGGPTGRCAITLTAAQQTGSKAITERHQTALDAKQKVANEARDEMRKAMHDPAVSEAKVKTLQAKVSEAMGAVMLERRAMMLELQALLTPEQKAAMNQRFQQGSPSMGPRKGMGRGKGMSRGGCGGGWCF